MNFIALALIMFVNASPSRVDSLFTRDTLSMPSHDEELLEQLTAEDGSALDDEEPVNVSKTHVLFRSRLYEEIQRSSGYERGMYLGSPLKSYQRLLITDATRYSTGLLLTKDAGERQLNDFMTGNITLMNLGPFVRTVLGDYRLEIGQGVSFWRGYGYSKGGEILTPVQKEPHELVSSLSSGETDFLRGFASNLRIGSFAVTIAYSRRSLGAAIDSAGNVTSIYSSGYFRTQTEQAKRNALAEQLIGSSVRYHPAPDIDVGMTIYRSSFSQTLLLDRGKQFIGMNISFASVFYKVTHSSTMFFGEWGYAHSVVGGNTGLVLNPAKQIYALVLIRSYPYKFLTIHGLGFGEHNGTSNERGIYFGLQFPISEWCTCSAYHDAYTFPVSISGFPVSGKDILAEVELHPIRRLRTLIRFQRKVSENPATKGFENNRSLQRMRLQADYRLSKDVTLRARAEKVFLFQDDSGANEHGFMVYQGIDAHWDERWFTALRVTFFQTDSYDTRITTLEQDLDGVLSLPLSYGTGIRWYFYTSWSATSNIEVSLKYSDVIRDDVKYYGSGLDQLPTNHDNRIGVQVDMQF